MTPDASTPAASTPAKPTAVAEIATSTVLDAGHTTSLLCAGARVDVAASACSHASVATSNRTAVGTELEPADRLRPVPRGAFDVAVGRCDEHDGAIAPVIRREPARRRARRPATSRPAPSPHGHALARVLRERRDDDGARRVADGDPREHPARTPVPSRRSPLAPRPSRCPSATVATRTVPARRSPRTDRRRSAPRASIGRVDRLRDGDRRSARRKIPHAHDAVVAAVAATPRLPFKATAVIAAAMTEERDERRARGRSRNRADLHLTARQARRR